MLNNWRAEDRMAGADIVKTETLLSNMLHNGGRENKFDLKDVSMAYKSNDNSIKNKKKRQHSRRSWLRIENNEFCPIWITYNIKKKGFPLLTHTTFLTSGVWVYSHIHQFSDVSWVPYNSISF